MKIVLVATTSWNLYNSRMGLAKALHHANHEVVMLAPRDEFTALIEKENLRWEHFPLEPRGRKILKELRSIIFLISFYKRERPDIVNHYTPKGVIYGSVAAKLTGVKKIYNTITGLGYVFSGYSGDSLKAIVTNLYKLALKNTRVIFQNPDNQRDFIAQSFISPDNCKLIPGSGIDMTVFTPTPEPDGDLPVVILPSRFVAEKGIRTFVEASAILKTKNVPVRIVLVGKPEEDQPTSIPNDEITEWINQGLVEWWGWHNQMEKIYPLSHLVCLPTYYMEGIPKSLIEAAACGRPVIATDVPGCREIVQHGKNGYLVPVKDPKALADAIQKLALDPQLRQEMGLASREIATAGFSIEKVAADYFDYFGLGDRAQ